MATSTSSKSLFPTLNFTKPNLNLQTKENANTIKMKNKKTKLVFEMNHFLFHWIQGSNHSPVSISYSNSQSQFHIPGANFTFQRNLNLQKKELILIK